MVDKQDVINLFENIQEQDLEECFAASGLKDKELESNNYDKTAKECDSFDCKKELLAELLEY